MGILDYLILAGIAVGILAAVRHLKFLAKFSFQRISMG